MNSFGFPSHLLVLVFTIALGTSFTASGQPPLRFLANGFSPAQEFTLQESLAETRQTIQTCSLLGELFPWLQKKMLELVDSGTLEIRASTPTSQTAPNRMGECASSSPSYFTPSQKMTLQPQAFSQSCYGLERVLFHELVHMSWTFVASPRIWGWASEGVISSIEAECATDGIYESRRSHYH